MVLPLMAAIERVPESLEEAARNLGATGWQVFRRVLLPLSVPGLVSGSLLVYSVAISALVTPALMKALLAALTVAERRLDEVLAQYGAGTVREAIPALLDYGERRARQIFEAIPDGRYEFWDYLEGDLFARHDVRIKVAVTVAGNAIHLDFTGTDPQLRAALNMVGASSLAVRTHALP